MVPPSVSAAGFRGRGGAAFGATSASSTVITQTPTLPQPTGKDFELAQATEFFHAQCQLSPFYLPAAVEKPGALQIDRYSDKYRTQAPDVKLSSLGLPREEFPEELHSVIIANYAAVKRKVQGGMSYADAMAKIEKAMQDPLDEGEEEEKEDALEDNEENEEIDEEELEDDNDYCVSYFDGGDDYDDGAGGGADEGPVY